MLSRCQCLDQNNHQGWYGECFVQVLAAAAGLQCSKLTPDCTGVDFEIAHPGEEDTVRFPEIKVQVKSWRNAQSSTKDPTSWQYPRLTQKRFNGLAGGHRVPRYLFLVIVPSQPEDFAFATPDQLILNHSAYWASFADQPRINDPSCITKKSVLVPKANLLTVESLVSLLKPLPVRTAP